MKTKWIDDDRRYITRSAEELDQYLSSEVLLWRMSRVELPLCPGNLLLALERLNLIGVTEIAAADASITELLNLRRVAWEKKVTKELAMRVQQWSSLVEDCRRFGRLDDSYHYNVRTRVMIELLNAQVRYPEHELEAKTEAADAMLALLSKPGEFIWDERLSPGFPQEQYPFLYVQAAGGS